MEREKMTEPDNTQNSTQDKAQDPTQVTQLPSSDKNSEKTIIYNEDFTLNKADIEKPIDPIAKYAISDHDFGRYIKII